MNVTEGKGKIKTDVPLEKLRSSVQEKTWEIVIAEGESGEQIRYAFAQWQGKGKDNIIREYLWASL